jgi:hypothetical protein
MSVHTEPTLHSNTRILREIYADLTRLADHAAEDIVLHRADRATGEAPTCQGRHAVRAHERGLIDATRGTLTMAVQQVVADDHFGAVLGVLRASAPRPIEMPFCGLWRFAGDEIVEHWENAYDPAALGALLQPS